MNSPDGQFEELLARLFDGELNDDDRAMLAAYVAESPAAMEEYLDTVATHAALRQEFDAAPSVLDLSSSPQRAELAPPFWIRMWSSYGQPTVAFFSKPTPLSLTTSAVIVTLVITALAIVAAPRFRGLTQVPAKRQARPKVEWVASLSYDQGAVWAEGQRTVVTGAHLARGETMRLESGLAEIRFESGARLLMAGPATLQLDSDNSVRLEVGKMSATVDEKSQGFAVDTSAGRVVDLGTRFGVSAEEAGRVQVFVDQGQVEVTPAGDEPKPVLLSAGQSWQSGSADQFASVVTKSSFAWSVDPYEVDGDTESWRRLSDAIRQRGDLLAYYDFQRDPGDPTQLINVAPTGAERNGTIHGARWTRGRWEDKQALEFAGPDNRVEIEIPGEYAQLSMVVSVLVEPREAAFQALLNSDGWGRAGQLHWHVMGNRTIQLAVSREDQPRQTPDRNLYSTDRVSYRRWTQIAVTIDTAEPCVEFYFDGRLSSESTDSLPAQVQLGKARIGNWSTDGARRLRGRIDELLIFNTVLSAEEIATLRPTGEPTDDSPKVLQPSIIEANP